MVYNWWVATTGGLVDGTSSLQAGLGRDDLFSVSHEKRPLSDESKSVPVAVTG